MFTNPVKNLRAFGLREDMVVADLGAGTGFYAVAAGFLVPKGKVYAVEIDKEFLGTIKNKAKEAKLHNVEILWGNVEKLHGTNLADAVVDRVIASNVLFQIENKDTFIEEIKRILKKDGKVLLIDWKSAPFALGHNLKNLVSESKAKEMFEKKSFALEREIDAGAHHYGMILVMK